ncbi:MAG: RNA polymerase subunit sigma-70 [Acidobacteria bacterium]|nr:RNA polymerase subunit sigma-70 [Acidobacteriota bacterium]
MEQLAPQGYLELRRLAEGYMRGEPKGHTLQPTALIHEAYLRLVDHARARRTAIQSLSMKLDVGVMEREIDVLAIDEALERLGIFDERKARIVELRFFGGMTEAEIGHSMAISVSSVRRELRMAEAAPILVNLVNPTPPPRSVVRVLVER